MIIYIYIYGHTESVCKKQQNWFLNRFSLHFTYDSGDQKNTTVTRHLLGPPSSSLLRSDGAGLGEVSIYTLCFGIFIGSSALQLHPSPLTSPLLPHLPHLPYSAPLTSDALVNEQTNAFVVFKEGILYKCMPLRDISIQWQVFNPSALVRCSPFRSCTTSQINLAAPSTF